MKCKTEQSADRDCFRRNNLSKIVYTTGGQWAELSIFGVRFYNKIKLKIHLTKDNIKRKINQKKCKIKRKINLKKQ